MLEKRHTPLGTAAHGRQSRAPQYLYQKDSGGELHAKELRV